LPSSFGTRQALAGAFTIATSERVLLLRFGSSCEEEAVAVIVTAPAVRITNTNAIEEAAPSVLGGARWVA
jgi:hypothetical protein